MTWEALRKIMDDVKERFREKVEAEIYEEEKIAKLLIKPESILEVAKYLRDEKGFDHAKGVTGIDLVKLKEGGGPYIEVSYQLGSIDVEELRDVILNLSTRLSRDDPRMPSLYSVWPSVEYHEREVYEMLGVIFEGHPRLRRLLLSEYWMDIPPLRKDYRVPGRE